MKSKQKGDHLPGSVKSKGGWGQGTGSTTLTPEKSVPSKKFAGKTLQDGMDVVKPGSGKGMK